MFEEKRSRPNFHFLPSFLSLVLLLLTYFGDARLLVRSSKTKYERGLVRPLNSFAGIPTSVTTQLYLVLFIANNETHVRNFNNMKSSHWNMLLRY